MTSSSTGGGSNSESLFSPILSLPDTQPGRKLHDNISPECLELTGGLRRWLQTVESDQELRQQILNGLATDLTGSFPLPRAHHGELPSARTLREYSVALLRQL